ncbi:histone deacetylase [Desulforhopalus vacuolatus]|uniref:histone deacetylase family protein n=1 Tax=Desulforhopalus vacuolatus TaxID=40414 RepID=UPI0019631042|nr:histone deacetylase [Desulforhopalus vacuolatus]MBM9518638.1 histone deacetylase [Desulforhopalus vacuolatus]
MNETGKTGLVCDERCLLHDTGDHHPESASRLRAVYAWLKESGLAAQLVPIEAQPANQRWIEAVHNIHYIRKFEDACLYGLPDFEHTDNVICRDSYDAALLSAGGVLEAVDAVVSGRLDRVFCALRPPGHHAERDKSMGFCYFNNVAIAARYLQLQHGIEKVAIIDFDVHHGNGIQHIFEEDPTVLYCSLHEHPSFAWPGTGRDFEEGKGEGEGFTFNVPVLPGRGDKEYRKAVEMRIKPKVKAFQPEFLLVAMGFDAHADDLMADIQLTAEGFDFLSRTVVELAECCTGGRVISVLEGGYNPLTLPRLVESHLRILAGLEK